MSFIILSRKRKIGDLKNIPKIKFLNIKILVSFQIHTDDDKILVVKYWSDFTSLIVLKLLNWSSSIGISGVGPRLHKRSFRFSST